jgi:hypothetical protein
MVGSLISGLPRVGIDGWAERASNPRFNIACTLHTYAWAWACVLFYHFFLHPHYAGVAKKNQY